MGNQSVVAVPPNIEDTTVLRRFLSRLVEDLDIVLGNRASSEYVVQSDLRRDAEELRVSIDEARVTLEEARAKLEDVLINIDDDISEIKSELLSLAARISALEYKTFDVVTITTSVTLEEFKIAICRNTVPINVTLKTSPIIGDEIQIKRSGEVVTVIGLIDGSSDLIINVPGYSVYLVFNGTDWSTT